jgi:hypothetical protein
MSNKIIYQAIAYCGMFVMVLLNTGLICASDDMADLEKTVTVRAAEIYAAKDLKKFFLGKHYREAWITPIEVPVIDLSTEKGGLTVVQKGGGMQTLSLRLEDPNGKQYVLRSIQKYTSKAIPSILRRTFVADMVQDQISSGHPYGAFVIPKMAQAAGVYHTNPRLVFIPDTSLLGEYREEFRNMLALFEERPSGDQSDSPSFGNSKNVISSRKMGEKILEDNDNEVDQVAYARARLFDIFVGDWDRHQDQWRWAEFDKKGKGKAYRPIPRDRDQVFAKYDGLIPWVGTRKFALREFTYFKNEIRDLEGLTMQARFLDRIFLSRLTSEDLVDIAGDMQSRLTDHVIESAFLDWPAEIYSIDAEEIILKLKSRRDDLTEYAAEFYRIVAEEVEILGTHKHEYFEVVRLNNDETSVKFFKMTKKGKKKEELFSRTFSRQETKEIRLYGIGGLDEYHVSGTVDDGILIRIIGGDEEDSIVDSSAVRGLKKHTVLYDTEEGTNLVTGNETRDFRASDHVEYFNQHSVYNNAFYGTGIRILSRNFVYYDYLLPLLSLGYNTDDGVFVGGGVKYIRPGFRKFPYGSSQMIVGNVSTSTGAFNFKYEGEFKSVQGSWDKTLDVFIFGPNYQKNYFGIGNETPLLTDDRDFNRVRINEATVTPGLRGTIAENHSLEIGLGYQYSQARETADRFISTPGAGLTSKDFNPNHYLTLRIGYNFINVDSSALPKRGLSLLTEGKGHYQLNEDHNSFVRLKSEAALYFPLFLQMSLATRVGGAHSIGDFEFYEANNLGGKFNLRGYRKTRFSGRTSLYHNTELRMSLFYLRNYFIPSDVGILGFFDYGRVWADGESSSKWHTGYGGGIYISPLARAVLTATVNFSPEDTLLDVSYGFQF